MLTGKRIALIAGFSKGFRSGFASIFTGVVALVASMGNANAQTPRAITCETPSYVFNTAHSGPDTYLTSGNDTDWQIAWVDGASNPQSVPAGLTYRPATVIENRGPGWVASPYNNANWISHNDTGQHGPSPAGLEIAYNDLDIFYRYSVNLGADIDIGEFELDMSFYADNSVWEVYVNGVAQNLRSPGASYGSAGYRESGKARGIMRDFQLGVNEILVHVKSHATHHGFLAQLEGAVFCHPYLTLRVDLPNDNGGNLQPQDVILSAAGPQNISGAGGSADITEQEVEDGTYNLSYGTLPGGYTASQFSCVVDGDTGNPRIGDTFVLNNGENAVCTVTIDDEPARLTLQSSVTNNDGGTASPSDFTLTGTGPVAVSGTTGSPDVTDHEVQAGTYELGHNGPSGYASSDYSCEINGGAAVVGNSVELALGDVAICTILHDDFAPVKTLADEDGLLPEVAEPGETLTYRVVLSHSGAKSAVFNLVDDIDEHMTYVPGSTVGAGEPAISGVLTWSGLTVPPGQTVAIEYKVLVDSNLPAGVTVIRNTAYEQGHTPDCVAHPETCKEVPLAGEITLLKELAAEAGGLPEIAEPGETLTFRITLSNDSDAPGLYHLADKLDDHTTYVPNSTSGTAGAGEPNGTNPLVWRNIAVPAQSALTVEYQVKVADPIPDGVQILRNVVYADGGPEPDCIENPGVCAELIPAGKVRPSKKLSGESGDLAGFAEPGETLAYTITLTNEGPGPALFNLADDIDDHAAYVAGSTVGSAGAVGEPTGKDPLVWKDILVPENDSVTLEYSVKLSDSLPAGTKSVGNIAYKAGSSPDCAVNPEACIFVPILGISKTADQKEIRRGEEASFTIQVLTGGVDIEGLTVVDTIPPGFSFVEGSATVGGTPFTPAVEGRSITFTNLGSQEENEIVIQLRMQSLASAEPGEHINRAGLLGSSGQLLSQAQAAVEIAVETAFSCGDVIGTVFNDVNRNGYQDEGETGLPGVRVATVKGLLVTTDGHGRFNVPCADLPDPRVGSNFLMKLDPRTLPTGYRLTSENPRVVRLTAGKAARINFAATIVRVIRVDLSDAAFMPEEVELRPEWHSQLPELILLLENSESVLRLAYVDASADSRLAARRLSRIRKHISELWGSKAGRYRLKIETRVEASSRNSR